MRVKKSKGNMMMMVKESGKIPKYSGAPKWNPNLNFNHPYVIVTWGGSSFTNPYAI